MRLNLTLFNLTQVLELFLVEFLIETYNLQSYLQFLIMSLGLHHLRDSDNLENTTSLVLKLKESINLDIIVSKN